MSNSRRQKIEEMLAAEPNDPELHYMLAMEHASAGDDEGAVHGSREIDFAASGQPDPVGCDFAVHAQSRHASIRVDTKAEVRRPPSVGNGEVVVRVAGQRRFRQRLTPRRAFEIER